MKDTHSPIECILPPYMLERIAANGSITQREFAMQTIAHTEKFRADRESASEAAAAQKHEISADAATAAQKKRSVYNANHESTLPGTLMRQEGGPATGDLAADEAYDGAGDTFDLYNDIYQRVSVNGIGMELKSSVHYQTGYDNAFWDGTQMVYGDGDDQLPENQRLFNRFTIAVDVIGHELTHGVTQYTANLAYANQSGSLNESFSDVFGSLVKQRRLSKTAAEADWIIGEGLFTANVNGVGIRSMKAPGTAYNDTVLGKDPQPAHIKDYVSTTQDSGGVHINSGIPNHAFYLTAVEIGGYAWEKAGMIWYVTLRDKLKSGSVFQDAADQTYAVAGSLYGSNSLEQQAVAKGWAGVGITVNSNTNNDNNNNTNTGCIPGLLKAMGLMKS
jgi:Zn-dependent metalloprotease